MAGIRLEFAQFGDFDSFDIIRSTSSMASTADVDLPSPVVTGLKTMYWVDTNIVEGAVYYYKVRVWRDGMSYVCNEVKIITHNISTLSKIIFGNYETGCAFDFGNISTMFQDVAMTIPVTQPGQSVAVVLDLSGNNNHIVQDVLTSRPILMIDSNNKYYLRFNGTSSIVKIPSLNIQSNNLSIFTSLTRDISSNQIIAEFSDNYNSNSGTFLLYYESNGKLTFATHGIGSYPTGYTLSSIYNNNGGIFSIVLDLSLKSNKIKTFRCNSIDEMVTGRLDNANNDIGTYPIFIGGRSDGSYKTQANYYSMIILGRIATIDEISIIENIL